MPHVLRPYQVKGYEECQARYRQGFRRILYVLPTGGGKTTVAAHMISSAKQMESKVLFGAHRKELVDNASKRLKGEGVDHGVIMAGDKNAAPIFGVQVASIPTLHRRKHAMPEANLIIIDEAHHITGSTYQDLLKAYPSATVIGLTATPYRTDGAALGDVFETMVCTETVAGLIAQGWLVPVRTYTTPNELSYKTVKVKGNEFDADQLEVLHNNDKLIGDVYENWRKNAEGRKTLVFANSLMHAMRLKEQFEKKGVKSAYLDAKTPKEEREGILDDLERGSLTAVFNMGILTEGYDCPSISCVSIATATKSLSRYLQMAGRMLRLHPESGKVDGILLDHGRNVKRFGYVESDREYFLDGRPPRLKDLVRVKTCKGCFALFSQNKCPACGETATKKDNRGLPEFDPGELVEVQIEMERDRWEAIYNQLAALAERKGFKPQWAAVEFKKRLGFYPPKGIGPKKVWDMKFHGKGRKPEMIFKGYA